MDMAVLDGREYGSHPSYNTSLLTVMNMASSYDMVTDILLKPSVILSSADRISLHLSRALNVLRVEIHIILGIFVFTQGDTAALAAPDLTILDNPTLTPVRTDHTVLISCRRCPCSSGLVDIKSAYGNIIDTVFFGHEAVPSDEDLHLLAIGILTLEIGIEYRPAVLLLAEPLEL